MDSLDRQIQEACAKARLDSFHMEQDEAEWLAGAGLDVHERSRRYISILVTHTFNDNNRNILRTSKLLNLDRNTVKKHVRNYLEW